VARLTVIGCRALTVPALGVRLAAALVIPLAVSLAILLTGCASPAPQSVAMAASIDEAVGVEEAMNVQIIDMAVPGPAAGLDVGIPNRVGSAAVPVRLYVPEGEAWATLVWAHGGSFVRGTLDWPEADWAARRFAEAGLRVYSVDYALASDAVKAPAPSNDVAAVLRWVAAEHDGPLVVGGASAGGHLAALAALQQADRAAAGSGRPVDALILQYPTLHRVQREDAALAAATVNLLEQRRFDAARIAEMYAFYLGEQDADPVEVVVGELAAGRLAALPPTVIVNADLDELRASGEQFAEQLREAGVPVAEHLQPGTVHGYLNRPEESEQARAAAQASVDRFTGELRVILL
jgi:acetyl esterase/lipase